MRVLSVALLALALACTPRPIWRSLPPQEPAGRMFDRTLDVLSRHYFDTAFRHTTLKTLNEEFRPAALAATSATEEREVIWQLLTRVPSSHLTLLSLRAYQSLMSSLGGGQPRDAGDGARVA